MPELAFITQLKDEPIALVVLGAMVLYKIIGEIAKHIIPLISKTKRKSVEEMLNEDAQERKTRQAELDMRLGKMEDSIEKLFSIVTDLEAITNKASQGTLENILFNESQPIFKRLKSFLRLVALRVNGRIKEYGLKLVLQNKETWRDVLEAHIELKIADQKYFDDTLEDIDRKIFRY